MIQLVTAEYHLAGLVSGSGINFVAHTTVSEILAELNTTFHLSQQNAQIVLSSTRGYSLSVGGLPNSSKQPQLELQSLSCVSV